MTQVNVIESQMHFTITVATILQAQQYMFVVRCLLMVKEVLLTVMI